MRVLITEGASGEQSGRSWGRKQVGLWQIREADSSIVLNVGGGREKKGHKYRREEEWD